MSDPDTVYLHVCLFCLMSHHEWCQGGLCRCGCRGTQDERLITDPNRATMNGPQANGES